MRRVFLLSPANCAGKRASYLLRGVSPTPLAQALHNGGATIAEVFTYMSALYFRGKVAYAGTFGRPPAGWDGSLVIVPGQGLRPASTHITIADLHAIAAVPVDEDEPRYTEPLQRDATRLAAALATTDMVVLLGSIATRKYIDPLLAVLGDRLHVPAEFIGMGDMQRGSVMLKQAAAGRELTYIRPAETRQADDSSTLRQGLER